MSWSKITLIGMASYMDQIGKDLFQGINLPEGIEKDLVCNTILQRGGEFEVIYSDPFFMQAQIPYWSRKHYRTFDKWIKALNIEYEPLYNFDRYEEWTDDHSRDTDFTEGHTFNGSIARITGAEDTNNLTQTNNLTRTDDLTRTDNLTRTDDLEETRDTDLTVETKRSAMDAATYQPYTQEHTTGSGANNKTENTGTVKNTGTVTDTGNVKNTGTVKDTGTVTNTGSVTRDEEENINTLNRDSRNSNESLTGQDEHTGHLYGNIGVTTSQQMLQSELDIAKWNIYDHISDLFLQEFTIPIYE